MSSQANHSQKVSSKNCLTLLICVDYCQNKIIFEDKNVLFCSMCYIVLYHECNTNCGTKGRASLKTNNILLHECLQWK